MTNRQKIRRGFSQFLGVVFLIATIYYCAKELYPFFAGRVTFSAMLENLWTNAAFWRSSTALLSFGIDAGFFKADWK